MQKRNHMIVGLAAIVQHFRRGGDVYSEQYQSGSGCGENSVARDDWEVLKSAGLDYLDEEVD